MAGAIAAALAAFVALTALGAPPAAADRARSAATAPAASPATASPAFATPPLAAVAAPVDPATGRRPRKIIIEPPPPEPDPTALEQAAESNLTPDGPRAGIAFGAFLMGWQQVGTVDDAGRGGGLGLRLGHTASPNTVIWLELVAGAFPDENSSDSACALPPPKEYCLSRIESNSALVATAQRYVGPNAWLRAGAGFASYTQAVREGIDRGETRKARAGVTALGGAGVDLIRRHRTRLALESILTVQRFSAGWIFDFGFGVGVTFY